MLSMDLVVRPCGDHVIAELRGELDLADAGHVTSALTAAAAGRGMAVVDLADLAFIDCSGAAALVRAQSRVGRAGGRLLLAAPRPQARRVFELSRLADTISFYASVAQATGVCGIPGMAATLWPCVSRG
jgi:anti-sigma B factor antagonist